MTSHPLYNQNTMNFLTAEDIVGHPVDMNEVVFNFAFEPTKRIVHFCSKMQKYTNHCFTEGELKSLLTFNQFSAKQLIAKIKEYIAR